VHDFALNLFSLKSQYNKAFANVFGNTLIIDDLQTARRVGIGRVRMCTLDGNTAEASGVMRGGFKQRRRGSGFAEKDSLEKLEKVEMEIAELQGVMSNIEVKREENQNEISSLRNKKSEIEAEMIKLEKTLHLETGDLEATNKLKREISDNLKDVSLELTKVQNEITTINKELATFKSKKHMLRSQVNELRNPRLLAQLQAFEEAKQSCREDILRSENDLKNMNSQLQQIISPEQEKIAEIMKQHNKEEAEFIIEIKELSEKNKVKDKELIIKEKASKEFYSKYHQLFGEREKVNSVMNKTENVIEQTRDKMRESEREVNLVSLKNAEIKAKLAGLGEEFSKYKDAQLLKNKTKEELQKEISRFEVMLAQMSAVNMKALEIYEQVETEYNKLMVKKDSLITEKTDVLTMMNEIETKKKDHFMKTFNLANENFKEIFGNLFKKGKSCLQLDNPKNPFDGGLSIKVKITGNRYMDMKSLSGGEKTLTALSFIFAIQEYQPASFYILDEIDAALDKHNSEMLSKLIRSYANRAQYIVISHNDALISEADTLFGISMNEGVSKITSLKI